MQARSNLETERDLQVASTLDTGSESLFLSGLFFDDEAD
jgi:hypothetical protein